MTRARPPLRLALAGLLASGCSLFSGKQQVNMAPFAENTLSLVGDLRLETIHPVHLREFMVNQPQVQEARAAGTRLRDLMRGIIFYSLQVSSIGGADIPEERKSRELARYLNEALRARVRDQPTVLQLTEAQLDSILANVTQQPTYLGALRAAEPIINTVVEVSNDIITRFDSLVNDAQAGIVVAVEREYAPAKQHLRELGALESRLMGGYVHLSRYRLGDTAALAAARLADPSLALPARPTLVEVAGAEAALSARLATIKALREQLRPEATMFEARRAELDAILRAASAMSRAVRSSIILWSRAHRSMAEGIAIPPDIDVGGLLRGAAGKLPGM